MTDLELIELAAYRTEARMKSYVNQHRPVHSQIADAFRVFGEEMLRVIREHTPQ